LFFREAHGAETDSINACGRLSGFRRARFLLAMAAFVRFLPRRTFFVARAVFAMTAVRFFVTRAARPVLRLVPWRLNTAEGAAQFVNFALVREFLPLGDLDQFEHFIQHVGHLPQGLGNFGGMGHGLADGGGFCRPEISRLGPRPGFLTPMLRLGRAFRLSHGLRRRLSAHGNFHRGIRRGFSGGLGMRVGNFFRWRGLTAFFGVRFTEVTGGIGLGFRRSGVAGCFVGQFRG
jgi:hypothetical protein